jgi:CheY-like chemotaxis protein
MTSAVPRPFRLSPYFHPTTFCIVDDNESFLRSLVLEMPQDLAFRGFTRPEPALGYANERVEPKPLADRCFSLERRADGASLIRFDLDMIEQEISNPARFRRLSVALVDYAMPSINGTEFFERMRDPYTRRAMLTGVADEKYAVEMFNSGLIHRFIQKQKAADLEAILAHVADMQQEYFHQYLARLRLTLDLDPPRFLDDPAVAAYVERLMAHERLVEYYLVDDPPGFLLLRSNGSVVRLVLLDEQGLHAQREFAARHGAPETIVDAIGRGALVGLFTGDPPEHYHGSDNYPWPDHVLECTRLAGITTWFVGLARNPPMDIDFDPATASYDAYLRSLSR